MNPLQSNPDGVVPPQRYGTPSCALAAEIIVLIFALVELVVFEEPDEDDDEAFPEMTSFWPTCKTSVFKLFFSRIC